jgi:hypothetical protein
VDLDSCTRHSNRFGTAACWQEAGQSSSRTKQQGVDTVKGSAEVRFLLVSIGLLMALVVPIAAATFAPETDATPVAHELPATASASLTLGDAPPPLIFMALGTLMVVLMIGRRARRVAVEPLRDLPGAEVGA